jgi:hypothetical protein
MHFTLTGPALKSTLGQRCLQLVLPWFKMEGARCLLDMLPAVISPIVEYIDERVAEERRENAVAAGDRAKGEMPLRTMTQSGHGAVCTNPSIDVVVPEGDPSST